MRRLLRACGGGVVCTREDIRATYDHEYLGGSEANFSEIDLGLGQWDAEISGSTTCSC